MYITGLSGLSVIIQGERGNLSSIWHSCLPYAGTSTPSTRSRQAGCAAVLAPGEDEIKGQDDKHANDDVSHARIEQVHAADVAWYWPAQPTLAVGITQ